jgi:hypothetical protein
MLVGRQSKTLIPKEEGPFLKVVKFEVGVSNSELNMYLIHINPYFGKKNNKRNRIVILMAELFDS